MAMPIAATFEAQCTVHHRDADVASRLDELGGLTQDILSEAILGAEHAVALMTEDFPPFTRGIWRYGNATALLRKPLRAKGGAPTIR